MGTRDAILDAAARIMREQGYAHATTKEIARVAGFSEAALYKHFTDKSELFLQVLRERLPGLDDLAELTARAGTGSLRDNLVEVVSSGLAFYQASFPIAMSVFSSHQLLDSHRTQLARRGAGPRRPVEAVTGYLAAEQRAGRLRVDADPQAAAALLLGACLQNAFLANYEGRAPDQAEQRATAGRLVDLVLTGIAAP